MKKKKQKKLKKSQLRNMEPCEECGKLVSKDLLTDYEPFNEEVYGEKIPCRLCDDCAWEQYLDV